MRSARNLTWVAQVGGARQAQQGVAPLLRDPRHGEGALGGEHEDEVAGDRARVRKPSMIGAEYI
jgi:hypothetical protein